MSDNNYSYHTTAFKFLETQRALGIHKAKIRGKIITVYPSTISPMLDWSSDLMVDCLPELKGKTFLEIGCGSGVVSYFAALAGAKVTACDINPEAVECTRLNMNPKKLASDGDTDTEIVGHEFLISDVYSAVPGRKFDVVAWNLPYHGTKPADNLERCLADEDYKSTTAFFNEVALHLVPKGKVLISFSELGDLPRIIAMLFDAGLTITSYRSEWRAGYNCLVIEAMRKEDFDQSSAEEYEAFVEKQMNWAK